MKKLGLFLAAALLVSAPVQAATITFDNITAVWSNAVPNIPQVNLSFTGNGTGSASANWGTGGTSGYDFVAAATPFSVNVPPASGSFSLGTFSHRNQPIDSGSSITGIRLSITSDISVNSIAIGSRTFVFDFTHFETPNNDNPCADGNANGSGVNINGCADHVTFGFNSLSENFTIGGVDYTLNLNGFIVGGNSIGSFWTQEQNNNSAGLQAYVDSRNNISAVPEPATLVLLSLGLVGVGAAARRRRV